MRRRHLDLDDVPLRSVLCESDRHLERDNVVKVKREGRGGGGSKRRGNKFRISRALAERVKGEKKESKSYLHQTPSFPFPSL